MRLFCYGGKMETIYVDPENYGIDSGKLREMLEVLEKEAELHSISVKYEGKTYDVTSWKKAKIRLVTNITFLSFILKNEVAERVYSFGIPLDKI